MDGKATNLCARGNDPIRVSQSGKSLCLALLFFVLVSLIMVGPHIFSSTEISERSYAKNDSYICMWGLWFTKRSLSEFKNPYWADIIFYPAGTSLAFHAYPLVYGILSIPIQCIVKDTQGLILSMHVIVFISFVASGLGAYLLAAYVSGSRLGGVVAGLIFSFMPFHFLNMLSLHLLAIETLPFYLLSLLLLADRPRIGRAISLTICLALAYYSSPEYAFQLLLFSAIWVIYRLLKYQLNAQLVSNIAISSFLFIVLISPLLFQQISLYAREKEVIQRDLEDVTYWSPAALSFVTPSRINPIYGKAMAFAGDLNDGSGRSPGMRSETSIGLVTLGLALTALIRSRRDGRLFWAVSAACFLCLTLGPYLRLTGEWFPKLPMPYLFLFNLFPFLSAGRDPSRFFPLAMLMLAVLAAIGVREILRALEREKTRFLITAFTCGLVLFEYLPGWVGTFQPLVPPVYRQLALESNDTALIDLSDEPLKLFFQTVHGRNITHLEVTIPRSPSRKWILPIEHDFRFPERLFDSDQDELTRRVQEHKSVSNALRIRHVIFPDGPKFSLQERLALLMGGRVAHRDGSIVYAFW